MNNPSGTRFAFYIFGEKYKPKDKSMDTALNSSTTTEERTHLESSSIVKVARIFHAPIERVWRAWSNEELVKQWWGPESFTTPSVKINFHVGGKSLLAMQDSEGKIIWSGGVYKEIIPYKKIVMTDHFADEKGNVISASAAGMPGKWPLDCLITVEFSITKEGQTKMTIAHEGIPKEMHDDCIDGWNSSINKLQRLLEHH